MTKPMDDQAFEALLAAAYAQPSGPPIAPALVEAVLEGARRRRGARRAVLAMATLAGCAIVAAAIVATGMTGLIARTVAGLGPEPAFIDPSICLAVGFLLMLLAAARNAVREL